MRFLLASLVAAGLAAAGCSQTETDHVNPRGNYPDLSTGNEASTGTLSLDGLSRGTEPPGRYAPLQQPTLYSVYDTNGHLVTYSRTKDIDLDPGRYLVRIEDDDTHSPFWVTIEEGRTTVVNVDQLSDSDHHKANVR